MKLDDFMEFLERKQIRLQEYDYSSPGAYFVTLCTEKRVKVLSDISPRPTLPDIMCVYKSLTTRMCKKAGFNGAKLFQYSYFDHVIRNKQDYEEIWEYIEANPYRWIEKQKCKLNFTGEKK